MHKTQLTITTVLAAALAAVALPVAAMAAVLQGQVASDEEISVPSSIPLRMKELTDIKFIANLSEVQSTKVLLTWLVSELKKPSPTAIGFGGGPIDSSYIVAQLTRALASMDLRVLKWLTEAAAVREPRVRQALAIALGIGGDVSQKRVMMGLIRTSPDPFVRVEALGALGQMGAADTRDFITQSLSDPFFIRMESRHSVRKGDDPIRGNEVVIYPVRDMAKDVLRQLSDPEGLSIAAEQQSEFSRRLVGYRDFVARHPKMLKDLLKVTNAGQRPAP